MNTIFNSLVFLFALFCVSMFPASDLRAEYEPMHRHEMMHEHNHYHSCPCLVEDEEGDDMNAVDEEVDEDASDDQESVDDGADDQDDFDDESDDQDADDEEVEEAEYRWY